MSCCGVTIEAHRNADLRKTYAPRGRNYTLSGFSPLMQIRDGATVLMSISLSATANGSVFSVVGGALALTLKKADVLALASGPGDRLLSYDIVLSQGGIESWFVGGDFIVLDINATTTEGEQSVTVDLDGQSVDVTIMGGNIGIGASVLLADLNTAVESAEQSADDAAASLAAVPGLATTAGAAAGATSGASAGASAGTTAGAAAANAVVAGKADRNGGNLSPVEAQGFRDVINPALGSYRLSAAAKVRAIGDKLDGIVQLKDYYASGMAWADVFDSAFADVNAINIAGRIDVHAGNITLNRPVVVPFGRIDIAGAGKGATVFRIDHNGDAFRFKEPGGGSFLNSGISRCSITRVLAGAATDGSVVTFDGVGACYAYEIEGLGQYNGFSFLGNNRACMVYDSGLSDIESLGFYIAGGGNQYISRTDMFQNIERLESVGVAIADTEGIWLDQVRISRGGTGIKCFPGAGQRIQDIYMDGSSFDASYGSGAVFDINGGGVIRNVMADRTSFSGSAGAGIVSTGSAGRLRTLKFNNCFSILNQGDGAFIDAGTEWSFNQTAFQNNGNGGAQADRVGVRVGGAKDVRINNSMFNSFDPGDPTWNPVRQKHAVLLTAAFTDDFHMTLSNLKDQAGAAVLNNGSGFVSIKNCQGYINEASGVATIPVGSSFVTVSPGITPAIPSKQAITLTGAQSQPALSGVQTVWKGDITATTFDIVTSPQTNVTGAPLLVGWKIDV